MNKHKKSPYKNKEQWLAANPLYKWRHSFTPKRSLESLEPQLQLSRQAMSFWETSATTPQQPNFEKLAEIMQVDWLVLYADWIEWQRLEPQDEKFARLSVAENLL